MTARNITIPTTGPRRNSTFRFIAPFITPFDTEPPSLDARRLVRRLARRRFSGGGRTRGAWGPAGQPLLLELSHVSDDRPPVRWRDRPAVRGHQSLPVRDDIEDLPVRVIQDLLLVERRGGDVAP